MGSPPVGMSQSHDHLGAPQLHPSGWWVGPTPVWSFFPPARGGRRTSQTLPHRGRGAGALGWCVVMHTWAVISWSSWVHVPAGAADADGRALETRTSALMATDCHVPKPTHTGVAWALAGARRAAAGRPAPAATAPAAGAHTAPRAYRPPHAPSTTTAVTTLTGLTLAAAAATRQLRDALTRTALRTTTVRQQAVRVAATVGPGPELLLTV